MEDIMSKVSKESRDNARLDRDSAINPPDCEPGMDDFSWDSGGFADIPSTADDFSVMGGQPFDPGVTGYGNWGQQSPGLGQQPQSTKEDIESKVAKEVGAFLLESKGVFKQIIISFKDFDSIQRMRMGRGSMITAVIVGITGLVIMLLGKGMGFDLFIGSLLSVGVGAPLFMFGYEDFKNGVGVKEHKTAVSDFMDSDGAKEDEIDIFSDDDTTGYNDFDEEEDDDLIGSLLYEPDKNSSDFSDIFDDDDMLELTEEGGKSPEDVLDSVEVTNGMTTRQYLYEKITSVLTSVNSSYDFVKSIDESSDEFEAWASIVHDSAELLKKGNSDDNPYLISAEEKLFYVLLVVKRVKWLTNISSFVDEITKIVAFNKVSYKVDDTVYGLGTAVGQEIYIKIMKGATAMVSVKDAYKEVKNDILNISNGIPIVLGVNLEGKAVMQDFKSINSILVTGMPRSGKTWLILSILAQMMFYMAPSELSFIILDPKADISDFKAITTTHVRKFVSDDADILKELKYIVKEEAVRRKKIIGKDGFVNIDDFKKKNPDVEMPLVYVIIDEVVTLAQRMNKDDFTEFQGLLFELVSQLPALGIRIFMIPHIVKNDILKKSMTDIIPCRVSVMGDPDHIEKSTGTKHFEHKLGHKGDMAIRLNNDETLFIHSAVLASTNEGNADIFDFLTKFWLKIEPDSYAGSVYEKRCNSNTVSIVDGKLKSTLSPNAVNTYKKEPKVELTMDLEEDTVINDLLVGIHDDIENLW